MIIGKNSMLPINFLEKASMCSQAVGRIVIAHPYQSMGTGFMISDDRIMTCNFIIPDIATAENSTFQIDYFIKSDGTFTQYHEFKLDASKFFVTSSDLDVTIVAIKLNDVINLRGRYIKNLQFSTVVKGESVNIIHHALGEPQKISMRDGEIVEFSDNIIRYNAPTGPGSSGAPVFNDQWGLIGIHHSGGLLKSLEESTTQIQANEGIRISPVIDWYNSVSDKSSLPQNLISQDVLDNKDKPTAGVIAPFAERTGEENTRRDSVFISYAHKDQEKVEWHVELDKYIKNVAIIGPTRVWYDNRIRAGNDWRAEIKAALKKTKVAVLLVGPNFLNSDFILNKELPDLLEAAKTEGVKIIPLITHRVPYLRSVLGKFQSFNSPDSPLQEQRKNDAIKTLNEAVEEIAKEYDIK